MSSDPARRTYELIEELRAEVDFEIDDVISEIIRNLPDDYFQILTLDEQLTHLKALLAISICNLKRELTLRSEDERHVAVVARKNYPGLLAKILSRLPDKLPLVGAKIFTSKTHDFIIDLFEFRTDDANGRESLNSPLEIEDIIKDAARIAGRPLSSLASFVSYLHPTSQLLRSPEVLGKHFLAFETAHKANDISIRVAPKEDSGHFELTIASGTMSTRELFLKVANVFATQQLDIEQAFLDDLQPAEGNHIGVASFVVGGAIREEQALLNELSSSLAATD